MEVPKVQCQRDKSRDVDLLRAARKLGGSLAERDIPGWESTETAAEWVRSLRRESDQRQ